MPARFTIGLQIIQNLVFQFIKIRLSFYISFAMCRALTKGLIQCLTPAWHPLIDIVPEDQRHRIRSFDIFRFRKASFFHIKINLLYALVQFPDPLELCHDPGDLLISGETCIGNVIHGHNIRKPSRCLDLHPVII